MPRQRVNHGMASKTILDTPEIPLSLSLIYLPRLLRYLTWIETRTAFVAFWKNTIQCVCWNVAQMLRATPEQDV